MASDKTITARLLAYAAAPLFPVCTALLRVEYLGALGPSVPFLTFYPAVILAALVGGFAAGAVASLVSGLLASYLWIAPLGTLAIASPADRLATVVFLACGLAISFITELLHRARLKAAAAEAKVRLAAEQEQGAAALRRERNFLRQVIDAFPGTLYVKDREGNLCLVNEALARFHGTTVDAMEGKRADQLGWLTHELEARCAAGDDTVLWSRQTVRSALELPDAEGQQRSLETARSPLVNEDGSCDKVLVVSTDVTERQRALEALKENRELLDSIISGTPDAIYVKDLAGRYLLFNRAAQQLTGKRAEEVLGRQDGEVFCGQLAHVGKGDRLVLATRSVDIFEEGITDALGRKRTFHATKGPLYDDQGNLSGIFGILRDVSEQKEAEEEFRKLNDELDKRVAERTAQLEAAIREQESFSYSVSHDLRSPLRHINSYASILAEELGDNISHDGKDYLDRICRASSKMAKLIDDLLELARSSRLPLSEAQIDLSRLAKISSLMLQQTDKTRRVEVSIADGLQVLGDKTLLRLVVDNLLHNAWKYTAQEKVARIEVGSEIFDGREIFYVSDNGTGFDMAYHDKLFEAFQRLHGAEYEGNGIGLATVKRVIERHGGAIWAEGEVGNGATFFFTLGWQPRYSYQEEPALDTASGAV